VIFYVQHLNLSHIRILHIYSFSSTQDDQIQRTLTQCLKSATVLTIAHRLDTVIKSDKIVVMESGRVIEFDTPENLLANHDSTFSGLWDAVAASSSTSREELPPPASSS
jgi:ABC-type multidrug transport system ATPase subunit